MAVMRKGIPASGPLLVRAGLGENTVFRESNDAVRGVPRFISRTVGTVGRHSSSAKKISTRSWRREESVVDRSDADIRGLSND